MHTRGKIWFVIVVGLLIPGGLTLSQEKSKKKTISSKVVRSADQFYSLTEEDTKSGIKVRIEGTTLYSDSNWNLLFFGDNKKRNLYLPIPSDSNPPEYNRKAILTGDASWLNGEPRIANIKFEDLGEGSLPATKPLNSSSLVTKSQLNDWIFAAGIVVEAKQLDETHGHVVIAYLKKYLLRAVVANCRSEDLKNLVGAHVELNGCAAPLLNFHDKTLAKLQVFVPHVEQISVFQPGPPSPFDAHEVSVQQIKSEFAERRDPRLIRLQGQLVQKVTDKKIVIKGPQSSLTVQLSPKTELPADLVVGKSELEVAGFLWKYGDDLVLDRAFIRIKNPNVKKTVDTYPLLTTSQAIRALSPKLAAEKIPVEFTGTVTYYDPIWRVLFVQDTYGGIYVDKKDRRLNIKIGDLLRIKGVTDPGGYSPMVVASDVKKIASGVPPARRQVELGRLLAGAEDGQWTSIEGTVLSVSPSQKNLVLKLANGDSEFEAVLCGEAGSHKNRQWVGSKIRMDGVCGIKSNALRQAIGIYFHVPGLKQVEFVEEAIADPFAIGKSLAAHLLEFDPKDNSKYSNKMVRIEGIVTYSDDKGRIAIQDESGGLLLHLDSFEIPVVGETVNVVGFPVLKEFAPSLKKTMWQTKHLDVNLPQPPLVRPTQEDLSSLHGQQIKIQAEVLANHADSPEPHLTLKSEDRVFTAELSQPFENEHKEIAAAGSSIEITGVLDFEFDRRTNHQAFKLLCASAENIETKVPAPWWKEAYTLFVVIGLAFIGLLGSSWSYFLRKTVTKQTKIIEVEASARVELAARHKNLVDSANELIFSVGDSGKFITYNPATERLFDSPNDKLAGQSFGRFLTPEYQDKFDEILGKLSNDQPHTSIALKTSSGTILEIAMRYEAGTDNGSVVHCIARDVSERDRLEEQIRHMQKLESIGQLAAGVAHDYNNLLTVILGNSDLLLKKGELSDLNYDNAEQIHEAALRAAGLTQQLLAFSRKQVMRTVSFQPKELMRSVGRMLQIVLRENIELVIQVEEDLPVLHADQTMLEQALLNLAMNSRDAMPDGGRLTLKASKVDFDEDSASLNIEMLAGEYVEFSVSDNGVGIDQQTLPNIFEPFYTTKEVGKGTGLGLSSVYGIVKQHSGWVDVESKEGTGTRIRFYLPTQHLAEQRSIPVKDPIQEWSGKNEKILIVEDEWSVRLTVKKLLEEVGYRVIEATDGQSALEIYEKSHDEIDLVLTDMVMPGISGLEMAKQMKEIEPNQKIIYCSGYSSELAKGKSLDPGDVLLSKPFDTKTLIKSIREKLDANASLRAG